MNISDYIAKLIIKDTGPIIRLLQTILVVLSSLRPESEHIAKQANVYDGQTFDFIIVGAGSAGCVVANRLTEIGNLSVLLIEAGGEPDYTSEIPEMFAIADHEKADWNYYSIDDNYSSQAHKNRSVHLTRGKMLSGSSGSNYLFYVRGNKVDYDNWAELGNAGWEWDSVLPYFEKIENTNNILQSSLNLKKNGGFANLAQEVSALIGPNLQSFKELGHNILEKVILERFAKLTQTEINMQVEKYLQYFEKVEQAFLDKINLLGNSSSRLQDREGIVKLLMTTFKESERDFKQMEFIAPIFIDSLSNYLQKIENVDINLRGKDGYIKLFQAEINTETEPYLKSLEEVGHSILKNTNGLQQIGYAIPTVTVGDGKRQSTGETYLRAAKQRPNLFVLKNTMARKVITENKTAIGVEIELPNGDIISVKAKQEVILSAGAINSPKILMLSGIGPKSHLEEVGVETILDSPRVGQDMQDHVMYYMALTGKEGLLSAVRNIDLVKNLGTYPPAIIGHIALNQTQTYPDYQAIIFPQPALSPIGTALCSHVQKLEDKYCINWVKTTLRQEIIIATVILLHPKSRGKVLLPSKDAMDDPAIYTGFYSDINDLERHAAMVEHFLKVLETDYFKSVNSDVVDMGLDQCKNLEFKSTEYWKCQILNTASSEYHYSGTCAMGPEGVVDKNLKVRGIEKLRVVDASVIPLIVSGNINAATIMIAEKASDLIKFDYLNN